MLPPTGQRMVEALPVGNGRLGAMMWGGIAHERLQLNEDTLYAGGPYDATSPDALAALPQVRALIFAGRYAEAEQLADAKLLSRPLKQMPYQPLGDLLLDFDRADGISDYRRQLDLDTAVATTTFRSGGAVHRREVFVSAQAQCIVVGLSCDHPGGISLRVGIDSPQNGEVTATSRICTRCIRPARSSRAILPNWLPPHGARWKSVATTPPAGA